MSDAIKYTLDENALPSAWYNLVADLPRAAGIVPASESSHAVQGERSLGELPRVGA